MAKKEGTDLIIKTDKYTLERYQAKKYSRIGAIEIGCKVQRKDKLMPSAYQLDSNMRKSLRLKLNSLGDDLWNYLNIIFVSEPTVTYLGGTTDKMFFVNTIQFKSELNELGDLDNNYFDILEDSLIEVLEDNKYFEVINKK